MCYRVCSLKESVARNHVFFLKKHHTWCLLHVFPSTKSGLWHVIMHVSTDIFETNDTVCAIIRACDSWRPKTRMFELWYFDFWPSVECCAFLLGGCSVVASKIIPFTEKQLTLGTTWFNKIYNYPVCWGVLPVVLLRFITVDVKNQPDQPWEPIHKRCRIARDTVPFERTKQHMSTVKLTVSSSFWRKRSWITHPIKKGLLSISTQIHSTVMMHPLVN